VVNGSPSAQNSLLIDRQHGLEAARLLRGLELGLLLQCNRGGLAGAGADRQGQDESRFVDGVEKEIEQAAKTTIPGTWKWSTTSFPYLRKRGRWWSACAPGNRTDDITLPSLTPVWRSAEFQEERRSTSTGLCSMDTRICGAS